MTFEPDDTDNTDFAHMTPAEPAGCTVQCCTGRHGKSLQHACRRGSTSSLKAAGDCSRLLVLAAMASCQTQSALLLDVSVRPSNAEAGPSEEPPSETLGGLHACLPELASAGSCPVAACAEGCLAGGGAGTKPCCGGCALTQAATGVLPSLAAVAAAASPQ